MGLHCNVLSPELKLEHPIPELYDTEFLLLDVVVVQSIEPRVDQTMRMRLYHPQNFG
jgi:hypothetical protein